MNVRACLLLVLAVMVTLIVAAPDASHFARADGITPNPAMLTAVARLAPTPVPTDQVPFQPSITIVRVDMLRRQGGKFLSTRQIRIGHVARYVVYFRARNRGTLLPRCYFTVTNGGQTFYHSAMWRKHGKPYFYLDGRFSAVYGKTVASFILRLGPAGDTGSLTFTVRLPKF